MGKLFEGQPPPKDESTSRELARSEVFEGTTYVIGQHAFPLEKQAALAVPEERKGMTETWHKEENREIGLLVILVCCCCVLFIVYCLFLVCFVWFGLVLFCFVFFVCIFFWLVPMITSASDFSSLVRFWNLSILEWIYVDFGECLWQWHFSHLHACVLEVGDGSCYLVLNGRRGTDEVQYNDFFAFSTDLLI